MSNIYIRSEPYKLNAIFVLHMPSRLISVFTSWFVITRQKKDKDKTMAVAFATLSRHVSSRPLLQFLDALLLRTATHTYQCLLENTLNPFAPDNGVVSPIDFFAVSYVVGLEQRRDA